MRTEPESSFTLRFFAAPRSPFISWTQLLPSRYSRASWHKARDASADINTPTPASLIACFNEIFSSPIKSLVVGRSGFIVGRDCLLTSNDQRLSTNDRSLIHLRHLRQHGARLRANRDV